MYSNYKRLNRFAARLIQPRALMLALIFVMLMGVGLAPRSAAADGSAQADFAPQILVAPFVADDGSYRTAYELPFTTNLLIQGVVYDTLENPLRGSTVAAQRANAADVATHHNAKIVVWGEINADTMHVHIYVQDRGLEVLEIGFNTTDILPDMDIVVADENDESYLTLVLAGLHHFVIDQPITAMRFLDNAREHATLDDAEAYDLVSLHLYIALLYELDQNYNSALLEINESLFIDDIDPRIYLQRSNVFLNIGAVDEAENDLQVAIALDPEFANAYTYHSIYLDGTAAIDEATRALELAPKYAYGYFIRALLYFNLNQSIEAVDDFNTVINLVGEENFPEFYRPVLEFAAESE